jgi:hypothetical protein
VKWGKKKKKRKKNKNEHEFGIRRAFTKPDIWIPHLSFLPLRYNFLSRCRPQKAFLSFARWLRLYHFFPFFTTKNTFLCDERYLSTHIYLFLFNLPLTTVHAVRLSMSYTISVMKRGCYTFSSYCIHDEVRTLSKVVRILFPESIFRRVFSEQTR